MSSDTKFSGDEFIDSLKNSPTFGYWDTINKSSMISILESNYTSEILKTLYIEDVIIHDGKTLINWKKRFRPLTDEEISEKYGR